MSHVGTYVQLAYHAEQALARSFRIIGDGHADQADIFHTCHTLAKMSDAHAADLEPVAQRYRDSPEQVPEPERLHATALTMVRPGQIGLLRDLQDLHVLGTLVQTTWTVLVQGAQGLRDHELLDIATHSNKEASRQLSWLNTRMKTAAPQALIVA